MSALIEAVFGTLDMVVLKHAGDDNYEVVTETTPWFREIWHEFRANRQLTVRGASPFLDHFVLDAALHWQSGSTEGFKSGPFIEVDSDTGEQYALEASALTVQGDRILIITNLGKSYEDNQVVLQAARENLLTQEQLEIEVSKRTIEIREREGEVASRLIYAAGFRDEETGTHIKRIGLYSAKMGEALGWIQRKIDDIHSAAPMHDIGKIGIKDAILKKPGLLTDEERQQMEGHATIGERILAGSTIPMIQMAAEIAGNHHESWDGSGYPKGIVGEDIPITARIVAIVDVYDALVHRRVYKEAIDEGLAMDMMKALAGTKFDPSLFELFVENLDAMRTIRTHFSD